MLQLLPQIDTLTIDTHSPGQAINYINSYIESNNCQNMSIDLSYMNILDAAYVSTMCSTSHYIKYPEGKIQWIISSEKTEEFTKDMMLGNSEYIIYD